jgi:hypothetical protein
MPKSSSNPKEPQTQAQKKEIMQDNQTLRHIFGMVQAFVDIHRIVHHVRLPEKLDLRLQDLVIRIQLLVLQKLQEREHKMPVEVRRDGCCEIILRHIAAS